jgi:hypothetical protein
MAVIPAKAGIQKPQALRLQPWTPAFAGVTEWVLAKAFTA